MGTHPFTVEGQIKDLSGTTLATVACHLWRASDSLPGVAGEEYAYRGVCDLAGEAELVNKQNRRLNVDGDNYTIVEALKHPHLGYIELGLNRVRADG